MSQEFLEKLESQLRSGKPDHALASAMGFCKASDLPNKEKGIEIAKAAANVWRDLIAEPVLKFHDDLEGHLEAEVTEWCQKALGRLFKIHEKWENKLWDVHMERMARELRDNIRVNNLVAGAENVHRLMVIVEQNKRMGRASYIGTVMGTVINHPKEADNLLKFLAKKPSNYDLTPEYIGKMSEAYRDQRDKVLNAKSEFSEQEWRRQLVTVSLEIQDTMPPKESMESPTESHLRDVGDVFRSLFRVPILNENLDLFYDATLLAVEFLPKEHTAAAQMAGIEKRLYTNLGHTAVKTVNQVYAELGQNKFFVTLYCGWGKLVKGTDHIHPVIEFMGALKSPEVLKFLKEIQGRSKITGKATASHDAKMAAALSAVGDEESIETLKSQLKTLTDGRLDATGMKKVEKLLEALGNALRSPNVSSGDRKSHTEFIQRHVPEDQTRLAMVAAVKTMAFRVEQLTPQQRQWAVRALVKSLWMADQSTAMHKGENGQYAHLGFRAPIVEALKRFGKSEMETIVHTMEPFAMRYNGAFMAAGELFQQLDDEKALPILEKMLLNTIHHDSANENLYQKESIWDPATEQRIELTPEKILSTLVYAIGSIGSQEAKKILFRYQNMVKAGRVPPPDVESAKYMDQLIGDFAVIGASKDHMKKILEEEDLPAPYDPSEVKALLKQLTKSYFLSSKEKKRIKKIQALTRLGQITAEDALPTLFSALREKDVMVQSALITCLAQYGDVEKPEKLRDALILQAIESIEGKDPKVRDGAVKVLHEIAPLSDDWKIKIMKFGQSAETEDIRNAFRRSLQSAKQPARSSSDTVKVMAEGETAEMPDNIKKLELKRQYMEARHAWVQGGKRGDPPPKPEGLD